MPTADDQRNDKLAKLESSVATAKAKLTEVASAHETERLKHEDALTKVQTAKGAFVASGNDDDAQAVVNAQNDLSKVELYLERASRTLDDARAEVTQAEKQRDEYELSIVAVKCDGTIVVRELEKLVAVKADAIREAAASLHKAAATLADDAQAARRRKLELQKALGHDSARTEAEIRSESRTPTAVESLPRLVRTHLDSRGTDMTALRWLNYL